MSNRTLIPPFLAPQAAMTPQKQPTLAPPSKGTGPLAPAWDDATILQVGRMADDLGVGVPDLVMAWNSESEGLDPAAANPSGAVGLNQLRWEYIKDLDKTVKVLELSSDAKKEDVVSAYAHLSVSDQLKYIKAYYNWFKKDIAGKGLPGVYVANFLPGQLRGLDPKNESQVIASGKDANRDIANAYKNNWPVLAGRDKGTITVGDMVARAERALAAPTGLLARQVIQRYSALTGQAPPGAPSPADGKLPTGDGGLPVFRGRIRGEGEPPPEQGGAPAANGGAAAPWRGDGPQELPIDPEYDRPVDPEYQWWRNTLVPPDRGVPPDAGAPPTPQQNTPTQAAEPTGTQTTPSLGQGNVLSVDAGTEAPTFRSPAASAQPASSGQPLPPFVSQYTEDDNPYVAPAQPPPGPNTRPASSTDGTYDMRQDWGDVPTSGPVQPASPPSPEASPNISFLIDARLLSSDEARTAPPPGAAESAAARLLEGPSRGGGGAAAGAVFDASGSLGEGATDAASIVDAVFGGGSGQGVEGGVDLFGSLGSWLGGIVSGVSTEINPQSIGDFVASVVGTVVSGIGSFFGAIVDLVKSVVAPRSDAASSDTSGLIPFDASTPGTTGADDGGTLVFVNQLGLAINPYKQGPSDAFPSMGQGSARFGDVWAAGDGGTNLVGRWEDGQVVWMEGNAGPGAYGGGESGGAFSSDPRDAGMYVDPLAEGVSYGAPLPFGDTGGGGGADNEVDYIHHGREVFPQ